MWNSYQKKCQICDFLKYGIFRVILSSFHSIGEKRMKKIISRYYFFVAILLVIAYQEFSSLILYSDFAASLSGFAFYLSDMMLNFLVVLFALLAMIWSGRWQQINSRKFKGTYLFYSFLAFLALFIWNFVTFFLSCDCRSRFWRDDLSWIGDDRFGKREKMGTGCAWFCCFIWNLAYQ